MVRTKHSLPRCGALSLLLALVSVVAGCASDDAKPVTETDPNRFPTEYRRQITMLLAENLSENGDFRTAMISEPALKPVMQVQRYVVCVKLEGGGERKEKAAIFLGGTMQQFVDATPEQCGGVAYQPFTELRTLTPKTAR